MSATFPMHPRHGKPYQARYMAKRLDKTVLIDTYDFPFESREFPTPKSQAFAVISERCREQGFDFAGMSVMRVVRLDHENITLFVND